MKLFEVLEAIWSRTTVGDRLAFSKEEKSKLAKAAVSFVISKKNKIGRIVLGSGTTILNCATELMENAPSFEDLKIHTANLLVVHEFVWRKPETLFMELPSGEIDWSKGTLCGENIDEYFKNVEVEAVMTTFSGMSFEKGFYTIHDNIKEKLANLKPNPETCRWVIIPIAWRKIGQRHHIQIANKREDQLEFVVGKERKYIIITDKPSENEWNKEEDDEKLEELAKWKETYKDGFEIIYA